MDVIEWIALAVATLLSAGCAGHALLHKRDPRAAFGWIAVCLLFPLAGPVLYVLFGVNRTRSRAQRLEPRRRTRPRAAAGVAASDAATSRLDPACLPFVRLSNTLADRPIVAGNRIAPLHNGEEAFPAMLEAIAAARTRISLATYIFETNATGERFVEALAGAMRRGVEVRVIVDGIGELYSFPPISRWLRRRGVPVARFLPPRLVPPSLGVNLRNHRKILVVDGIVAFTGGMNIGDRHLASRTENPRRVLDTHFRLEGPVAAQIEQAFLDDWAFATGETVEPLPAADPFPDGASCRVLVDGPDDEVDRLALLLAGAVASARRRVTIVTPYFLPPPEMTTAIEVAALRGTEVTVVLPERNNLPYVHWATRNILPELLEWGVKVYYQPPPFVHTKIFLADEGYAQIGSANLDPRSLRLNFEIAVEVFDPAFVSRLDAEVTGMLARSREVTLEELAARSLPVRLRDAAAWLFSPYL
jgi:cardiolipin synthase